MLCAETNFFELEQSPLSCVPAVYLGSAHPRGFAILPVRRINNLHRLNSAYSSIPTAPTISPLESWAEAQSRRGSTGRFAEGWSSLCGSDAVP